MHIGQEQDYCMYTKNKSTVQQTRVLQQENYTQAKNKSAAYRQRTRMLHSGQEQGCCTKAKNKSTACKQRTRVLHVGQEQECCNKTTTHRQRTWVLHENHERECCMKIKNKRTACRQITRMFHEDQEHEYCLQANNKSAAWRLRTTRVQHGGQEQQCCTWRPSIKDAGQEQECCMQVKNKSAACYWHVCSTLVVSLYAALLSLAYMQHSCPWPACSTLVLGLHATILLLGCMQHSLFCSWPAWVLHAGKEQEGCKHAKNKSAAYRPRKKSAALTETMSAMICCHVKTSSQRKCNVTIDGRQQY